jgi:hypothetical protein
VDILLPLIEASADIAPVRGWRWIYRLFRIARSTAADLFPRDEVPRHIADAREGPDPQPILVDLPRIARGVRASGADS